MLLTSEAKSIELFGCVSTELKAPQAGELARQT
jgi:hypothetical protein